MLGRPQPFGIGTRSVGLVGKTDMCMLANPLETPSHYDTTQKQTVEMRSPDGSADLYQLIAGLAVACRYGFEIDDALGIAEKHMSM